MIKEYLLDHGYVALVDSMGSDLSVVRAARVSHDADWRSGEDGGSDARLIRYLASHRHTSPFESVVFSFEVKCPIFVARQWMRHRTWSYNEVSARYSPVPSEYYVPEIGTIGLPAPTNKQGREAHATNAYAAEICAMMDAQGTAAIRAYNNMLAMDCPRELARAVLPQSMYTRFFGTVDLHNLTHFIRLREHPGAQWEIQQYAEALRRLACEVAPISVEALLE